MKVWAAEKVGCVEVWVTLAVEGDAAEEEFAVVEISFPLFAIGSKAALIPR